MNLNREQRRAVLHREGPCMVLAGPGSGKTTVLTSRVESLTATGVPPEKILVITFTRAAAEEMKARYLKRTHQASAKVTFGTFHAVFFYILRMKYRLTREDIAAESDRISVLKEAIRKTNPSVGSDRSILTALLGDISYIKNHAADPAAYTPKTPNVHFGPLYQAYRNEMEARGKLDFDDMLLKTDALFREDPDTLAFWRDTYEYLLIDEFQDINPIQYAVVKRMAAPKNNLFIVGDDDQSIYGFRGASSELMLRFPKDYPDAETIILRENYRSRREIVEVSDALIRHNRQRFDKKQQSVKGRGGNVNVLSFPDDVSEAAAIASEVEREIRAGTAPDSIAVLVRTHAGSTGIVKGFMERKIPFFLRDKPSNLFEHTVLKPVFAVLNFASGSQTRKNFLQFMNCPYRHFRREDLDQEDVDLKELTDRYRADPERRYLADRVRFLEHQLNTLTMLSQPYAMIHYFRIGMGYDGYVRMQEKKTGADPEALIKVLDEAQASARECDTVEQWYRFVANYTRALKKEPETQTESSAGKVTVSTIHAAKGLEYHTVFIPDVVEKNIPHEKAAAEKDPEEERRLLYVAMTRAAEKLTLLYTRSRLGKPTEMSRFLKEIGW